MANEFRIKKGLIVNETDLYVSGSEVGIGTVTPTDKLDVFSSSSNQRLIRFSHPTAPTQAAGFFGFNTNGTSDNVIATFGVQYSSVYYNVINIDRSNRYVGIGTTTPSTELEVNGTITGNGSGLTNLNASNLSTGTVNDARLPGTISSDITGNAATATKWATARTLTIGDTGKSVDGSGNVSWNRTEIGITKTNIDALNIDADTIDGLNSSQFLRSDTSDTATGNIRIENANNIPLRVTGSSASYTSIFVGNSGAGAATLWLDGSNGDLVGSDYAAVRQTNDKHLELWVGPSGGDIIFNESNGETMRLKDGNVGIGTTSPDFRLQVNTPEETTDPISFGFDITRVNSGTRGMTFGMATNDTYGAIGTHNADLQLGHTFGTEANGQPAFYPTLTIQHIDETVGNVGIGTTSPDNKLHVVGNTLVTGDGYFGTPNVNEDSTSNITLSHPVGGSGTHDFITIADTTNDGGETSRIVFKNRYGTGDFTNGQVSSFIANERQSSSGIYDLVFGTATANDSDASEKMRITHLGNVGIGIDPDGYGKLTVNGTGVLLALRASSGAGELGFYEGGAGRFYLETLNGSDGLAFVDGDGTSERMRIDSSGNVGIGTTSPSQKLTVAGTISGSSDLSIDGNSVFDGTVGYNTFNSGFGGNGWRIDSNANAEFENLTVRGTFSVYELLAQQIRATNGSLLVATSGKVDTSTGGSTGTLTFDTGNIYGHGFLANDIILAQRLDTGGTSLKRTFLRVDSRVNSGSLTYTVLNGDNPEAGQEFVRIGNTSDTDRQGHIYLTADDSNAPYIGVRDGVSAYTDFTSGTGSVEKVRVGRLDGVTSANFGSLSGYGLWASGSVYLEGGINATFGEIGGWTINTDSISGGDATIASSGNLTLGQTNDVVRLSADDGTYRLWTGHATAGSAPFRVTKAGALTATSATITGNITAETGYIGTAASGFDINSSYFANGKSSLTDANAGVYVGTDGISLGASSVFKVEDDGALTATDATITGNITANTGNIGGFTISGDALAGNNFYLSGSATGNEFFISSSNFNVKANGDVTGSSVLFNGGKIAGFTVTDTQIADNGGTDLILKANGQITASAAQITGDITATNITATTAGNIAGWSIDSSTISKVGGSGDGITLDSTNEVIKVTTSSPTDVVKIGKLTSTPTYGIEVLTNGFGSRIFHVEETTGSLAGFEFSSTQINDTDDNLILKANGQITASAAQITGDITANSGQIANFSIIGTELIANNTTVAILGDSPRPDLSGSSDTKLNVAGQDAYGFYVDNQNYLLRISQDDFSTSLPAFRVGSDDNFLLVYNGEIEMSGSNFHIVDGKITASAAQITGDITAETIEALSGNLGNLGITGSLVMSGDGSISTSTGNPNVLITSQNAAQISMTNSSGHSTVLSAGTPSSALGAPLNISGQGIATDFTFQVSATGDITGSGLQLTGISTDNSETYAVMIDNSTGVTSKRELGSYAFNSSALTVGTGLDLNSGTTFDGSAARTITLDLTEVGFGGGANRLVTDDGDGTVTTEANLTYSGTDLTNTGGGYIVDKATTNFTVFKGLDSNNNGIQMGIDASGDFYIAPVNTGTTDFADELRVVSGLGWRIDQSLGVGVAPNVTNGRIDASNDVVAFSTSDKRLKENITKLTNPLDKISKINGVEFDWKLLTNEERKTIHGFEGHDVGVIAQEIEEVLPEVVTERENGYKGVKYEKIVPLLIEGIKELKQENDTLKKELEVIKKVLSL